MRPARIATALVVSGLLTGCAGHSAPPPPVAAPPPMDTDPTTAPTSPTAGADPATTVAAATVGVFTDHDPDPARWHTALAPHLAPAARAAHAWTDPAAVPGHRTTGPAVLEPQTSTGLATVRVPTDAGPYTVLLSLTDGGAWQVERLSTPPGTH